MKGGILLDGVFFCWNDIRSFDIKKATFLFQIILFQLLTVWGKMVKT